ncbi:MAG: maleylacetoacetate isomerase [Proteobacteria bacterium]|nr:maleylacetoacetate isomerase [Pseudomonadota bacterium]MCH9758005.1 maleylacetoacetate isomerase [Pseudomonadota bacterium]
MKLYSYWRSSAAYRVRIAINLKHIDCTLVPVNIAPDRNENHLPEYTAKNPTGLVPTLELEDGTLLRQSLPIIEYLEKRHPATPLLPNDDIACANIMALALDIGMEIHPLNNLRVINHLKQHYNFSPNMSVEWMQHWIQTGFDAIENIIADDDYCYGNSITLADVFLMPQLYNALRWGINLTPYPRINRIHAHLSEHSAFILAHPDNQSDAVII